MEEKDVSGIANAVAKELAKLNTEHANSKDSGDKKPDESDNQRPNDIFKCPDCGGEVAGGIQYCMHCGCELEWEA